MRILNFKSFLLENNSKSDLIIVDVQPAYANYINFDIGDLLEYINNNEFDNVIWFYNGPELGYEDNEYIIQEWLINIKPEYEELINSFNYNEKLYGFFRELIDNIDEDDIITLLQYMYIKNINDIRDLLNPKIKLLDNIYNIIKELNISDYSVYIPTDLLNILKNYNYNNIVICGGGANECLKEIEICLDILNQSYIKNNKFIY